MIIAIAIAIDVVVDIFIVKIAEGANWDVPKLRFYHD